MGDDELAPAVLYGPPEKGVVRQDHHRLADLLHGLERPVGVPLREELEDALQMGNGPGTQPDRRHGLGSGRFALVPRARCSR